MPRQQILTRLSKFFDVVWVNRVLPWQEHFREGRSNPPFEKIPGLPSTENFEVYYPSKLLGEYYSPEWLCRYSRRARIKSAVKLLEKKGCTRIVLYLWRPCFYYALDLFDWDMTIYHIDDEYSFADDTSELTPIEANLIGASDAVIIHSPGLMARKGDINPNTVQIPNGVDFQAYSQSRPEPDDLAKIPRPRVGYVGVIKKQIDLGLLIDVAKQNPKFSFVFVGPVQDNHGIEDLIAQLKKLSNVFFLGAKPIDILPSYTQHIDIGMLPYHLNNYTHSIYPLKLHEYLASGIPVIASPITSVLEFGSLISLADDVESWSEAILREASRERKDEESSRHDRIETARAHDWDAISHRIVRLISQQPCHT